MTATNSFPWDSPPRRPQLEERVTQAAEAVLRRDGSVGPLELLQQLLFLPPGHVENWRNGNPACPVLEDLIQLGAEKHNKTMSCFLDWVQKRQLKPIDASYTRRSPAGMEELRFTRDGNPEKEKFYRTHYAPANLPQKKAERLAGKLKQAPDLVVFQKVSEEGNCSECGVELLRGSLLLMEKGEPLCLACGDLDQLVFLPRGDMALSRRSRKYSPLSAVVVRFNRSRKRYERQGLLVTPAALDQAERECAADAPERAAARDRAAVTRHEGDREFNAAFTQAILARYPACPKAEATRIAEHAGLRSSGRVGRSAAGRALDPKAVDLAVIAHIRHEHTNYDHLLMQGTERLEARVQVREQIEHQLQKWTSPG